MGVDKKNKEQLIQEIVRLRNKVETLEAALTAHPSEGVSDFREKTSMKTTGGDDRLEVWRLPGYWH